MGKMGDTIFQKAYARVRARYSEEQWLALTPRQITEAIYREIRQLDAERTQTPPADRNDSNPN
jgi:hypothetical protein